MRDLFRTTVRFDPNKPDDKQAAALLQRLHAERRMPYSALIAEAVNAHFGIPADHAQAARPPDDLRETIRAIVREEMAAMPLNLGGLVQALQTVMPAEPAPVPPHVSSEPDEDDLDDAFEAFGC